MSAKNSYREQLLNLKWEAFDKGDYKTVKLLRLKIKEYDAKHPPKEKVKPYELFEGMKEKPIS